MWLSHALSCHTENGDWLVHSADCYWALATCQVLFTLETPMNPRWRSLPSRNSQSSEGESWGSPWSDHCLLSACSFCSTTFLPSRRHQFPSLCDCHILFSRFCLRDTSRCPSRRFSSGYSSSCDFLSGQQRARELFTRRHPPSQRNYNSHIQMGVSRKCSDKPPFPHRNPNLCLSFYWKLPLLWTWIWK